MRTKQFWGSAALLLAALLWGTTFAAQKSVAGSVMGPFTFNGIRSLMGSAVLLPVVLIARRRRSASAPAEAPPARQWTFGALCGLLVFAATNLQQFGIGETTAGKSGFVTALYVVLVPVFAFLIFRRKTGWNTWLAVALAAAGLYLLCVKEGFTVQFGDLLTFGCALVFSFHILTVDRAGAVMSGVTLSCMQFFISGSLSLLCMALFERPTLDSILAGGGELLYSGVMSCGVAYTLQIVGQKHTDPTVASLLMSLEAVFAVLSGWIVLGESLIPREWIGCVVMFAAIVFAQLPLSKRGEDKECFV